MLHNFSNSDSYRLFCSVLRKMAGETTANKQIIFQGYISGELRESNMAVKESSIQLKVPEGSEAVLVKNLYLSCDPYLRGMMEETTAKIPRFKPGSVIKGYGVSKVVDSGHPDFQAGDLVTGITGWEEYSLRWKAEELRKIESKGIPLSYYTGVLGMTGFTAYLGFHELCTPKKGEYVFVSAASGAVGHIVGQLAKLHGCYVVGSCGSDEKVDLVKKLGFDEAFNYKKNTDFDDTLKRYFPKGIDIYFDNVGGKMLDAVLLNMRRNGRIAACGMISRHDGHGTDGGIHNLHRVVINNIKIQGFMQSNYLYLLPKFMEIFTSYVKEGHMKYIEDVREGLESAPSALVGLFAGKNLGKLAVRVAGE
ncbi:2-alkenal reductase (NADP(+)-dependent)-like [Tasmannia lanceolata]|uniref:2-alkenal reductase (NADP(+)-dependent)-like n=1 Tax=Tasmannia lanceolata TaxID=3420 RepID=UPI004063BD35